tara:strand:+ start:219 stop:779 length:561 start_codon:yes stop_codon:yes gene_type:complete
MKVALLNCLLLLIPGWLQAEGSEGDFDQTSRCHLFIDHENIWTLEILKNEGIAVPILNIITLSPGEWEFRPRNIHLYDSQGRRTQIQKFSMNLGTEEFYVSEYLKVLGNNAIGLDLIGQSMDFFEITKVFIDLGTNRFYLNSIDCVAFDSIVEKINQIDLNNHEIQRYFKALQIELTGTITAVPVE